MMAGIKVLVLTDHSVHSPANSVYSLSTAMLKSEIVSSVDVASRGLACNDVFFEKMKADTIWAAPIQDDFKFRRTDELYRRGLRQVEPNSYDLILIRFPYPVVDGFFDFMSNALDENKIINRPSGILETSTKAFLLNFPEWTPPCRLLHDAESVKLMADEMVMVLKPLRNYGGKGIVRIVNNTAEDGNSILPLDEFLQNSNMEYPVLGMKYLKNVGLGDKRIVVANGEIITSSLRVPKEGGWLCNVAQGGSSTASEPDEREVKMVEAISPVLKERGIVVFGMDTLVDDEGQRVLSEINTLSIGGIYPAELESNIRLSDKVADGILKYFANL